MAIKAIAQAVMLTKANGLTREDIFNLVFGALLAGDCAKFCSANVDRCDHRPGFR